MGSVTKACSAQEDQTRGNILIDARVGKPTVGAQPHDEFPRKSEPGRRPTQIPSCVDAKRDWRVGGGQAMESGHELPIDP